MGLQINTNVPGLRAGNEARRSNRLLGRALEQLASGRRINRAADDASGLAIAERFNSQIRQSQAEVNNLQSGLNLSQTAEGGLQVQADAVQRLRDLAVQAGNGTLTDEQRQALNQEAQQLIEQIGGVAEDTQFNGQNLLDQNRTIDLGAGGSTQVTVNESTVNSLGLNGLSLATQNGAAAALSALDTAQSRIDQNRASLGAQSNRFERAIEQRQVGIVNASDAESRIRDLDFARASIERSRNELRLRGGLAALIQSNITPQSAVRLLGT